MPGSGESPPHARFSRSRPVPGPRNASVLRRSGLPEGFVTPTSVPPTFAEKDLDYYLRMIRGDFAELEETHAVRVAPGQSQKNIVILLDKPGLGSTDALGARLLRHFMKALVHSRVKPRAVILVHEASRLALEGSEVQQDLSILEEQGVRVLVCVVSADEFGISDSLKVGFIADMDNICDHLMNAWKVIRL